MSNRRNPYTGRLPFERGPWERFFAWTPRLTGFDPRIGGGIVWLMWAWRREQTDGYGFPYQRYETKAGKRRVEAAEQEALAVFLNCARTEGDAVISRVVNWDGKDSGDLG